MGKCHSLGYRNAALLFPEKKIMPTISWLVDADEEKAKALQPIYGDARVSIDWREAISDPPRCRKHDSRRASAKIAAIAGRDSIVSRSHRGWRS